MSDNKRPYDDEQVNINDLNDGLDKTKQKTAQKC